MAGGSSLGQQGACRRERLGMLMGLGHRCWGAGQDWTGDQGAKGSVRRQGRKLQAAQALAGETEGSREREAEGLGSQRMGSHDKQGALARTMSIVVVPGDTKGQAAWAHACWQAHVLCAGSAEERLTAACLLGF